MNTNNKLNVMRVLVASAALLFVVGSQAEVIKSAMNNNSDAYPAVGTSYIKLTTSGATVVNFTVPAAGRYLITYSASCAVTATTGFEGDTVSMGISVDSVDVSPIANNFCGKDYGFHSITVRTNSLSAGAHQVRIQAASVYELDYYFGPSILIISR